MPEFIKRVKSGEGSDRLMGFGHRVYKSYDPRAKVIKQIADLVLRGHRQEPAARHRARARAHRARRTTTSSRRKLYPNVDFYSGLIYQAMGFPVEMFPVLFAIPRTAGWIAQWEEMLLDPEQKIARPRQIYYRTDAKRTTCRGRNGVECADGERRSLASARSASSALTPVAKFDSGARLGASAADSSRSAPGPQGLPAIEQTRNIHQGNSSPPTASPPSSRRGTIRRRSTRCTW